MDHLSSSQAQSVFSYSILLYRFCLRSFWRIDWEIYLRNPDAGVIRINRKKWEDDLFYWKFSVSQRLKQEYQEHTKRRQHARLLSGTKEMTVAQIATTTPSTDVRVTKRVNKGHRIFAFIEIRKTR